MKKTLNRRQFLALAGAAGGSSILAACSSSVPAEAPAAQEPAAEAPAAQEPAAEVPAPEAVTITFSGWGASEEDEGVQAAIKVFEEETPNIKVNWLHIPDSYQDKILSMAAAGTPPDTGFVDNGAFRTYVRDGLLLDITDNLQADSVVGAKDYFIEPQETTRCTYDGRWYGIGSCWVAPHVYYNADVFEEAGIEPPSNDPAEAWDWATLLQVATQLTVDANGNHPSDSGFDINNVDRWGIHWPTWSIPLHGAIASNGGYWIDPDSHLLALDKPEAFEALQAVADLMLKHQVMPSSSVFEEAGGMADTTQMLETGRLAMAVDGSWALSWMCKINAKLGTAVLPMLKQPGTDMQAHLHSAFAETKNPDAAWQWVRFLATEFYQLLFLRIGLWLPSQTALMTPEGMEKWYTLRTSPSEGIQPEGYDKIVTDYVPNYGHVLYMPPGYPKADSIITPALDAIWVGDMTAEEAMVAAVPEANAILEAEQ